MTISFQKLLIAMIFIGSLGCSTAPKEPQAVHDLRRRFESLRAGMSLAEVEQALQCSLFPGNGTLNTVWYSTLDSPPAPEASVLFHASSDNVLRLTEVQLRWNKEVQRWP